MGESCLIVCGRDAMWKVSLEFVKGICQKRGWERPRGPFCSLLCPDNGPLLKNTWSFSTNFASFGALFTRHLCPLQHGRPFVRSRMHSSQYLIKRHTACFMSHWRHWTKTISNLFPLAILPHSSFQTALQYFHNKPTQIDSCHNRYRCFHQLFCFSIFPSIFLAPFSFAIYLLLLGQFGK